MATVGLQSNATVQAIDRRRPSMSMSSENCLSEELGDGVAHRRHSWATCRYCPQESFKSSANFITHLRLCHCTREGGSNVCRYGFNGVCSSLPVDGVSDSDYETHVLKYHVRSMNKEVTPEWTIYSAAQNLAAVLNDPSRGKQSNLFTKKWGDSFVDKAHIAASPHLATVSHADFDKYIARIGRRYRRQKHPTALAAKATSAERESKLQRSSQVTVEGSLRDIPEIFLKDNLKLNHAATFAEVFPGIGKTSEESKQSGRLLQEQLSHYLDIVEVEIAQQVSQKSVAFFHAMTSQDAIMEEMAQALRNVRELRDSLQCLHSKVVVDPFRIMCYAKRRQNYEETLDRLCLMATVHQAQPMLQSLLGDHDYVAALDLIDTTQEILSQELMGVHCFKHLPLQLAEMETLIDKMLSAEFERYASADLNRPLVEGVSDTNSESNDGDKLVCIVMGLLRKRNFRFMDTYEDESIATIRAVIKQLVIEVIASSDAELCLTGSGEESQSLSISEWVTLLMKATVALLAVLQRIKSATEIMMNTADVAAGYHGSSMQPDSSSTLLDADAFLSESDYALLQQKVQNLLMSVCNYCHERCVNLVSTQSLDQAVATAANLEQLVQIVDEFCAGCKSVCGITIVPLKVAVKAQASRFANHFHSERKQKLVLLLDSELWRQVEIPNEFQKIIERIESDDFSVPFQASDNVGSVLNGHHMATASYNGGDRLHDNVAVNTNPVLLVDGKPFALFGAALLLVQMLSEYCRCAMRLPIIAGNLSRHVVDLLLTFNSRSCQLIIGADAMRVAGLKSITIAHLALVSRALQLVLWLLPKIKSFFQRLDQSSVFGYESTTKALQGHIAEIDNKIYTIVTKRLGAQLQQWDARPPVPSQSFRTISRQLVRLHEAIAQVLPDHQVSDIYAVVHRSFKDKLRKQLVELNIVNNGGPQHGVVTSELTFYMETLRSLKALPSKQLGNDILEDIWVV